MFSCTCHAQNFLSFTLTRENVEVRNREHTLENKFSFSNIHVLHLDYINIQNSKNIATETESTATFHAKSESVQTLTNCGDCMYVCTSSEGLQSDTDRGKNRNTKLTNNTDKRNNTVKQSTGDRATANVALARINITNNLARVQGTR